MMTLQTDRLVLRQWELGDFEAFAAMCADPRVMQFLSPGGAPLLRFQAWQSFCATIGHWHLRGFGMFAVVDKASGELAGRVGPWYPETWPGLEIAWTLRSEFWGRGYATEAAARCITFAMTELGQSKIISLIDTENVNSVRVADRLGEALEDTIALPHMPGRTIRQYSVTRQSWMQGS